MGRVRLRFMTQAFTSSHLRRSALAAGLCLLAFLFALEAKLARYSPASGPLVAIQSAKARPADLPELVSHGVSAHPEAPLQFALVYVSALTAIVYAIGEFHCRFDVGYRRRSLFATTYFSPGLFFRPPPALRIL
jgi:hypothetical protein